MPKFDKFEKAAEARAALDELFADVPSNGSSLVSRPENPFEEDDEELPDPLSTTNMTVVLSTRIELRGYSTAEAFMKRMSEAWGMEWVSVDNARAWARLPRGWTFLNSNSVTKILDTSGRLRATSSLQGGDRSWLKVLPRYAISAEKGFDIGAFAHAAFGYRMDDQDPAAVEWHGLVMDREREVEIHRIVCSASDTALQQANAELKNWLDGKYPDHRDPFAYWSGYLVGGE